MQPGCTKRAVHLPLSVFYIYIYIFIVWQSLAGTGRITLSWFMCNSADILCWRCVKYIHPKSKQNNLQCLSNCRCCVMHQAVSSRSRPASTSDVASTVNRTSVAAAGLLLPLIPRWVEQSHQPVAARASGRLQWPEIRNITSFNCRWFENKQQNNLKTTSDLIN